MLNNPMFNWDEENREATCILTDGQNTFYGGAVCHEDDLDMMSKKTGEEIAFLRAQIEAFKHYKNNVVKPQLKAYKELYYVMIQSTHFDQKSYENKMLQRKIREKQLDLDTANELLDTARKELRNYISKKDEFYHKIRANRNKANSN